MDFEEKLSQFTARIPRIKSAVATEEATKTALILPFIGILGYDYTNPLEVCPEYTADYGVKNGEKVDYAIFKDDCPAILIECKMIGADLKNHGSQLFRYFSTCQAKIGILTNGIEYRFFSDLERANQMDTKPFLEINLESLDEQQIAQLKRFRKEEFDVNKLLPSAANMIILKELTSLLNSEMESPSQDFVKYLASHIHEGRITTNVIDTYAPLVKSAMNQMVNTRINEKLKSVMDKTEEEHKEAVEDVAKIIEEIETTEEEMLGYHIVQAICGKLVPLNKVTMRDSKSYCAVLYDDNNRRPICRLHFNRAQKYLGIFDENKEEIKKPIDDITDIYKYQDEIIGTLNRYTQLVKSNGN